MVFVLDIYSGTEEFLLSFSSQTLCGTVPLQHDFYYGQNYYQSLGSTSQKFSCCIVMDNWMLQRKRPFIRSNSSQGKMKNIRFVNLIAPWVIYIVPRVSERMPFTIMRWPSKSHPLIIGTLPLLDPLIPDKIFPCLMRVRRCWYPHQTSRFARTR